MTSTETFHCTTCPSECLLTVCVERDVDGVACVTSVHGNRCPRGKRFAEQEVVCPMRILATTVVVEGGDERLVPVRTCFPIPRALHKDAMETIRELRVSAPRAHGGHHCRQPARHGRRPGREYGRRTHIGFRTPAQSHRRFERNP